MGFDTSSRARFYKLYQKIKGKSQLIWMYYHSPGKKIIDKTDSTIIRTESGLKRLMLQEGG